jgi:hypothetical protein
MWHDLLDLDFLKPASTTPDWTKRLPEWAQRLPLRLYLCLLFFIVAVYIVIH